MGHYRNRMSNKKTNRRANLGPRIVIELPQYVFDQVKQRAADKGVTMRSLLVEMLVADGYTVRDEDRVVDRRQFNRGPWGAA